MNKEDIEKLNTLRLFEVNGKKVRITRNKLTPSEAYMV